MGEGYESVWRRGRECVRGGGRGGECVDMYMYADENCDDRVEHLAGIRTIRSVLFVPSHKSP